MFGAGKPAATDGRFVLVTGASSGLGRACALHLADLGFQVFAGVRKPRDGMALAAESTSDRIRPVVLEVTDEDTVRAAVATIASAAGGAGLWALVNNAGVCVSAPLECLSPDRLRLQLDTNVVGSVTVTRLFLPLLRQARGRIVNVTSGLGRVALPYLGAYAASQFAKEAISDAMRRELRPSGVAVSVVRPGSIMTPIWSKVSADGRRILDVAAPDVAGLYRRPFLRFLDRSDRSARASRTQPEDFAAAVARALTARRPRTRYRVGPDVRLASVVSRVLPDAVLDLLLTPRRAAFERTL